MSAESLTTLETLTRIMIPLVTTGLLVGAWLTMREENGDPK